jgi:hypothetical protein
MCCVLLSSKQSALLMRNPLQNVLERATSPAITSDKNEWQIISVKRQAVKKGAIKRGRDQLPVIVCAKLLTKNKVH